MAGYERIYWEDEPSINTPLSAENLNKMDLGIANCAAEGAEHTTQIETMDARIDEIVALPDGSTTADAELVDIRVGAGGNTYNSAGTAVRTQIKKLASVSDTQPSDPSNRIWIKGDAEEVEIPTMEEFNEVKADLYQISDYKNNLFDASTATDGSRLDANGNVITGASAYYISDFIPVVKGRTYYKNQPDETAQHRVAYFASRVGPTLSVDTAAFTTAPTGSAFARFSGLLTEKETAVFAMVSADDVVARTNIEKVETATTNKFNSILETNTGKNMCNNSAHESGFINYSNGEVVTHATYYHTSYIPVIKGCIYGIYGANIQHFAMYDENRAYIPNTVNNYTSVLEAQQINTWYVFAAQFNGFMRFTIPNANTRVNFVIANSSDWFTTHSYNAEYPYSDRGQIPYGTGNSRSIVTISASEPIENFYSKMVNSFLTGNCDVIVGEGDYIFTNALVDQIRADGRRGVPIGNGCRYYFNGAHIYCEYTGENSADVVDLFSPLDSQNISSDYEIYNLNLISKNTCYALHDEANGGSFCRHIYRDCYIELDNTELGTENGNGISKALGGGLAKFEEVFIENCVFKATNPAKSTVYQNDAAYHGANNSAFTDAKIVVTGCYFENIFRGSNLGANVSEPYPQIIYTNNSCSGRNVDLPGNWTVRAWNNILR